MKIIAVEISIEHVPDEANITPENPMLAGLTEAFSLSLNMEVADDEPAEIHAVNITNELLRRYCRLNARKTN